MKERAIGLTIKELAKRKNLSVPELSQLSGLSNSGVYNLFKRQMMSKEEIEDWERWMELEKGTIMTNHLGDTENQKESISDTVSEAINAAMKPYQDQQEMIAFLKGQLKQKDELINMFMPYLPGILGKPFSGLVTAYGEKQVHIPTHLSGNLGQNAVLD